MLNKVMAGLVIAFWAAMMTALLRLEVFPEAPPIQTYPTQRVLQKIFSNQEPIHLNVMFNGNPIGKCEIRIIRARPDGIHVESNHATTADPEYYKVSSDLNLQLSAFGLPSGLWLQGDSWFNKDLELGYFEFSTTIGESRPGGGHFNDGHIHIVGDDRTKKVRVKFGFGDFSDERTFDFNQVKGAGFANVLGLSGMGSFLGGSGFPGAQLVSAAQRSTAATTTYVDNIQIAGNNQRVYLIYSAVDDNTWAKMWVDDSGQVLRVATSMGLIMQTDVPLGMDQSVDRSVSGRHWRD